LAVLPIANTDDSGCPYATDSAFGCADYYVSPDLLAKEYDLETSILKKFYLENDRVDFKKQKRTNKKFWH